MDTDKLENFIAECSTKAANIKESCNQKMLVFDEEEENLDADYDESCAGLSIEVLGFKSRIARWLRICNDRYRRAEISLVRVFIYLLLLFIWIILRILHSDIYFFLPACFRVGSSGSCYWRYEIDDRKRSSRRHLNHLIHLLLCVCVVSMRIEPLSLLGLLRSAANH